MKIIKTTFIALLLLVMGGNKANAQWGPGWDRYYEWKRLDTVISIPRYGTNKIYMDDDNFYLRVGFLGTEVEVEDNWNSWDFWDNRDDKEDDWRNRRSKSRRSRNVEYFQQHDHGTLRDLNFEIGVNNWLENGKFPSSDDLYQLRPINSSYVGLIWNHTTYISGPLYLDWGGGFNWYNYKFENAAARLDPSGGELNFYEDLNILSAKKSKLKVTYLNFNFIPILDFGKGKRLVRQYEEDDVRIALSARRGFRFGIGPYASVKLSQKAKYKYENEQGNQKDKDKGGFFVNNFKWGLRAQIGINRFDMFVAYDMTPLFENGRGPDLNPIAFGIVF